jgi:glucosamine-6-phosphate deaminase
VSAELGNREFQVDNLRVRVRPDPAQMGAAAAADAAAALRAVLARQTEARVVFASAPSQDQLLSGLAQADGIDWSRVTAFHMDEYVGLPAGSAQSFAAYLQDHLFAAVNPGRVEFMGTLDEPEAEARRYAALLAEGPIDLVCMGIGENGHIAFNDPGVADFNDPRSVKPVALDARSRIQQVNDGCFASLDDVPTHAITLTVPALTGGQHLVCVVPGPRKAEAVARTLQGPITDQVPATILRQHPSATLYLDSDSAGDLTA